MIRRRGGLRKRSADEKKKQALDAMFRVWVLTRAGNRCERCGAAHGSLMPRAGVAGRDTFAVVQVAHFKSRRIDATRWDPDNVVALCKGCHFLWAHHEPDKFAQWMAARLGTLRLARLNEKWKKPRRRTMDEVRADIVNLILGGNQ